MPLHRVLNSRRQFARQLRGEQTSLETLVWRELRDRRLKGWKFRRQVPINGYIADFVCFDARLIVEVDGPLHRKEDQQPRDAERDAMLKREGFRILRFDGDLVLSDLERVVREIGQALTPSPGV